MAMAAKSMTRGGKVSARERARSAKAALDTERAERERKIEDAATSYYVATDERDQAQAEVDGAEQRMAKAVTGLSELGEPVERIATLCGLDAGEVRRMLKVHRRSEAGSAVASEAAPDADTAGLATAS